MNILSIFTITQEIIIDRVEDSFVVVEWKNEHLSLIPLDEFYTIPVEGEQYRFRLSKKNNGTCFLVKNDPVVLQCEERTLVVPIRIFWSENSSLEWNLYPVPQSTQHATHINVSYFWHSL